MKADKFEPELDLNEYFESEAFKLLKLGMLSLPTGMIVLCDPLYSLPYGGTAEFEQSVAPGDYPVTICVFGEKRKGDHYMAAKIEFTKNKVQSYKLAMRPNEKNAKLGDGEIFGYPVESGLASFCDASTAKEYRAFCKEWQDKNKNKNLYDDYFSQLFIDSAKKSPKFQDPDGGYLSWRLPKVKSQAAQVMMFNSGFGAGVYAAYWGLDDNGEICSLVAPFISTEELD